MMSHDPISSSGAGGWRRFVVFAAVALALLAVYDRLRIMRYEVMSDRKLEILEAEWKDAADLVFTGDSRTQAAFVPSLFVQGLGCRVLNFGQSAHRYSAPYYDAIDRVIDERGANPTLLLGISAFSLSLNSIVHSAELKVDPIDRWTTLHLDRLVASLSPLTKREVVNLLRPGVTVPRKVASHHPDGWVTTERIPRDPTVQLDLYEKLFTEHKVEASLIEDLLVHVTSWTQKGFRVIGVRTPASLPMLELEDRLSGFDEQDLARRFEAAGGDWITLPRRAWETQDGGHVTPDAARVFSAEILPFVRQARERAPFPR